MQSQCTRALCISLRESVWVGGGQASKQQPIWWISSIFFFNHNILMIGIFWAFVNLQARDTHRIRCETPFYHSVTTRTFSDLLYTFPGLYLKVIWQRTMIQNEHRGLWTTYLKDLIIEDHLVEILWRYISRLGPSRYLQMHHQLK